MHDSALRDVLVYWFFVYGWVTAVTIGLPCALLSARRHEDARTRFELKCAAVLLPLGTTLILMLVSIDEMFPDQQAFGFGDYIVGFAAMVAGVILISRVESRIERRERRITGFDFTRRHLLPRR